MINFLTHFGDALCKKIDFFLFAHGVQLDNGVTSPWLPLLVSSGKRMCAMRMLGNQPSLLVVSVWFLGHPPCIKTSPSLCHLVNLVEYCAMFYGLDCLFWLACSAPMMQVLDSLIMFN